jgi:hypothetical protein
MMAEHYPHIRRPVNKQGRHYSRFHLNTAANPLRANDFLSRNPENRDRIGEVRLIRSAMPTCWLAGDAAQPAGATFAAAGPPRWSSDVSRLLDQRDERIPEAQRAVERAQAQGAGSGV